MNFQFDATTDGRPIKIVSTVEEHTRECLGGRVDRSITGEDLVDELHNPAAQHGYPTAPRRANSPDLACTAMGDTAGERAGPHGIPPGQPGRNSYVGSFNARVRDECLNINDF